MITLHTFGPMFGLPDPSPFVTKADVLLKMSGVPYRPIVSGLRGAPKGKLPYIEDDGQRIADSTLIRMHLESKYGVDFDNHLDAAQKGIAWAVEKMLEEQVYFATLHARWLDDTNFEKGPARFFDPAPAPLRPLIRRMVRGSVRKGLHAQGLGRHSNAEIAAMTNRSLDALAGILGDRRYLLGDQKCGADATTYAFVTAILCPLFDTPIRTNAERHRNLHAYNERMRAEFYPELK